MAVHQPIACKAIFVDNKVIISSPCPKTSELSNNVQMTARCKDLESFPTRVYAAGYPAVAAFIASDKDSSTAIYRKYERLSARNLLNLENEVAQLQSEQDQQDAEDQRRAQLGDIEAAECLERWEHVHSSSSGSRQELNTKIRLKLKEYRT